MDAGRLALAISQFYSRKPMSDVKVRVSPWKRSVGRMAQAKESRTPDKRHQWSQKEERKPETAWFEIDFDRKDEDVVAVFDLFLLGLCDCLIHSHSVREWATCYFSWKIISFRIPCRFAYESVLMICFLFTHDCVLHCVTQYNNKDITWQVKHVDISSA